MLSSKLSDIHQHALVSFLETIDALLGLKLLETSADITDKQKRLIIERTRVREEKDYARSDEIRDELEKSGIAVRDTASGSRYLFGDARQRSFHDMDAVDATEHYITLTCLLAYLASLQHVVAYRMAILYRVRRGEIGDGLFCLRL